MTHIPGHKKKRKFEKKKGFDPAEAPSATNRPSGGLVGGTKFDEFRQRAKEARGQIPSEARTEVAQENIAETARIKALPGQEELRATAKQEQVDIRAGAIASQEAEVQKGIQFQEEQIEGQSADQGLFLNAAGIIKKVPILSSAFKLGGKLGTTGTELFGIGTQAERDASREWWGGRVTTGDIIGTVGFVAGVAALPSLTAAIAPRMAGLLGMNTSRGVAVRGLGTTGLEGAIGRGALPGATAGASRALKISKGAANKASLRVSGMTRIQLIDAVKKGIAFIKANKSAALIHQGATMTTAWFAGDNLMTLASMNTRDISSNVRFGNITREQGLEELDAAQSDVGTARWGFRFASVTNPVLYPMWAMMESNANSINRRIDAQREQLGG